MNKKLIIGIVAVVVILGAGAGYFAMQDDSKNNSTATSSQTASDQSNQKIEADDDKVSGSLSTVSKNGKAQECTFTSVGSSGSVDGKMYTDGKGRGLMEISLATEQGNQGKSHTLLTTDKVYSWTETGSQTFGVVYDKTQLEAQTNSSQPTQETAGTNNQSFDFDCKNWTVDEAKLTVPEGVNFQAFAQPTL